LTNFPVIENPKPIDGTKKIGFVVASTSQGTFILNRFDSLTWQFSDAKPDASVNIAGISAYLLENSSYDEQEAQLCCQVLDLRRRHHGDDVIALDVGANIGVFTVIWARHMAGWGRVIGIEAQERMYYALCGNIALNNCWNAQALRVAISDEAGSIRFNEPDYRSQGSFGALELKNNFMPGQELDPSRETMVQAITIDSLRLFRLDFLKLDIQSMEGVALRGAAETIKRFRPVISIEVCLDREGSIRGLLEEFGYTPPSQWPDATRQAVLVHPSDPIKADLAGIRATGD